MKAFLIVATAIFISCSSQEFNDTQRASTKPAVSGNAAPAGQAPSSQNQALSFDLTLSIELSCASQSGSIENLSKSADKIHLQLKGPGPHKVSQFLAQNFSGSSINTVGFAFSGKNCKPEEVDRDVVFVIDASYSMEGTDPYKSSSDTCWRKTAIETIAASLPTGKSRLAATVFDSEIIAESTNFTNSLSELYTDLKKTTGTSSGETLCKARYNTNYEAALKSANSLLSLGRAQATKEIYFISDGLPNSGAEGIDIAQRLKSQGVIIGNKSIPVFIATAMIGPESLSNILKGYIASKDAAGNPIHATISKAENLPQTLKEIFGQRSPSVNVRWYQGKTTQALPLQSSSDPEAYATTLAKASAADLNAGLQFDVEFGDRGQITQLKKVVIQ